MASPPKTGGWLYWLLLALQTAGTVLLYWEGLPIYRNIMIQPRAYDAETTATALGASASIQVAYWIGYRIRPEPPRFVSVSLGHIVLFLSKLILVLPSAVFSFLFIAKDLEASIPISKYVFILFALFSLFCYGLELERLAARLLGHKGESSGGPQTRNDKRC